MANTPLHQALESKMCEIEHVVRCLADMDGDYDLNDLRRLLLGLSCLLDRDPGIEMGSDDVYLASRALVEDGVAGLTPHARKRRLVLSALARLGERVRARAAALRAASAAEAEAAPAVAMPFRLGLAGLVGPQPMCAPAL